MADIRPFAALRPPATLASRVASRPYDVLSSAEAREEALGNPYSYLHITKAEIDLPADTESHAQVVYDKAKENLARFQQENVLRVDDKACLYIYELVMKGVSQTGLVCVSSLRDYDQGIIKKHELTRPDKELDRIRHMMTTRAQTGNVFIAYKTHERVDKEIGDWKSSHLPQNDFTTPDGIRHITWVIDDDQTIGRLTGYFAREVAATYIADGHHRAASAAKVRTALHGSGDGAADYFLTTLFPSHHLHILDYNRLIKDLNGLSNDEFLFRLQKEFMLGKLEKPFVPRRLHEIGMYLGGDWYKLVVKPGSYDPGPIGVLDVTILQDNILDKLLDIRDVRTDKRIDFVGGIRGLAELEKRVNTGEMKVAFSVYPVTIEELFAIADAGNIMPPKSTWFEPKLRDGLFTHPI